MRPAGKGPLESLYFGYPKFAARRVPELDGVTARHPVLIAGAGPIGMTAALVLSRDGIRSVLIDRKDTFNDGSRAICIARPSMHILERVGAVAPFLEKALGWRFGRSDYRGEQIFRLEMPHPANEKYLPMYNLQQQYIEKYLHDAVVANDLIDMRWQSELAGIEPDADGVSARIASPEGDYRLDARYMLAADGARSKLRERAGIATHGWDYDQSGIVVTVGHERAHHGRAEEHFLPAGPFAILPLKGNRSNIVWAEPRAVAEALLKMDEADFLAELRRRFGDFLGELSLEGPRFGYPLSLQLAERMIDQRVALAGDSAHGIHPLAGQGLNLGLKDCAALAECIADAVSLGLDPGDVSALERYQRWRRFDNVTMALGMEAFDKLFSNEIAPVRAARRLGLAAVNAVGPARRFFMKYAGGAAGNLPKLLRGESLAA